MIRYFRIMVLNGNKCIDLGVGPYATRKEAQDFVDNDDATGWHAIKGQYRIESYIPK